MEQEPSAKAVGSGDALAIAIRLTKALRHASRTPVVARGVRWSWTVLSRVSDSIAELLSLLDRPDKETLLLCPTFRSHIAGFHRFANGIRSAELSDDEFFLNVAVRLAVLYRQQIKKFPTSLHLKSLDRLASACFELILGAMSRHLENLDFFNSCRNALCILLTNDPVPPVLTSASRSAIPDFSSRILTESSSQFSLNWAPGQRQASFADLEGLSSVSLGDQNQIFTEQDSTYPISDDESERDDDEQTGDSHSESFEVDLSEICKMFQLRYLGCSKLLQFCSQVIRPELNVSFSELTVRCSVIADSVDFLLRIISMKFDNVIRPAQELLSSVLSALNTAHKTPNNDDLGGFLQLGKNFFLAINGILQIIELCSSPNFSLNQRVLTSACILKAFISPHSASVDDLVLLTEFPRLPVNPDYLRLSESDCEHDPWMLSFSRGAHLRGESSTIFNRTLQTIALFSSLLSFATYETLSLIEQAGDRSSPSKKGSSMMGSVEFISTESLLKTLLGVQSEIPESACENIINYFDVLSLLSVMTIHISKTDSEILDLNSMIRRFFKFLCRFLPMLHPRISFSVFQNVSQKHIDLLFGLSLVMAECETICPVDMMGFITALSSRSELSDGIRIAFLRSLLNCHSEWVYDFPSYSMQFVFMISVNSATARSFLVKSLLNALSIQAEKTANETNILMSRNAACIFLLSLFSDLAERQENISQIMRIIIQKTNLSFASVMNRTDSVWKSLLFLANLSVQYLHNTALVSSKVPAACMLLSKAPELDFESISSLASICTSTLPNLMHCQGIVGCDQFCDRLFHLLQDVSRKIQSGMKNGMSNDLLHYQSRVFLLIDSLLGLLTTGSDTFSGRYETMVERSALFDHSTPVTAHFIQQCSFRMRCGADKLLPPDPVMWLLDSLDSVTRFLTQKPADAHYWWIHLGMDTAVNALSYHLLHDDADTHLPEMFCAVLFRLLASYANMLRTCVNALRISRQAKPGEESKLAAAISTSLEFGIATKELSELPPECTTPIVNLLSKESWRPSFSNWTTASILSFTYPGSEELLFRLRKIQKCVALILNVLKFVVTTWPAVCHRQRHTALSVLKGLIGSRIEPLGHALEMLSLFEVNFFEPEWCVQESAVQLSHVHSVLHDIAAHLTQGSLLDGLSRLAIDCIGYLRRQSRATLTSFYLKDSKDYCFTDIVVLFLRGDASVGHETLRFILILTEQASQPILSNQFRCAFLSFTGADNGIFALVRAPTSTHKVSATEQRIREQCWTLLRRFLCCHDEDPSRISFCSMTVKSTSNLVENLLVEGASSSAIYSAVSIMCRSASPDHSITVLSRLLPVLCNRSAACVLDALDEVLEFGCSGLRIQTSSDEPFCFFTLFPTHCVGALPESGASYLYYVPESSPIELCSFCARHCYSNKSSDVAFFNPNSPQLSRKHCLCTQRHDVSAINPSRRLQRIADPAVLNALLSSLEKFICSRIDLIGKPSSRFSVLNQLQISSYISAGSLVAPSSGQQAQPVIPPAESFETTLIYRKSPPIPASFAIINQREPLLAVVENGCVNIYQNWKPDSSFRLKLCSSTCIPFAVLGIYSQKHLLFVHGARDAHVLKFDCSGKRIKRMRPDLILEALEAAAQTSVCILSAKWLIEVPRLIAVTVGGILVFDFTNESLADFEPIYTSTCASGVRIKGATIWKNRYVYAVSDSGSILSDDIIDGMGQLRDVDHLPIAVSLSSDEPFTNSAQSNSGSGVSIHFSDSTRTLVVTWSIWGTRLFNVNEFGSIVSAVVFHALSHSVTSDVRSWIDVSGAQNLIIGVVPDCNRIVALEVSDCSSEAWCRSMPVVEPLVSRGRGCLGAVDVSPTIRYASVLLQQDNGSYNLLSQTDIVEPQLVCAPCFQSFLDAPDPSSSKTTGSGGGESIAWTYRDVTIFERSKCVTIVPVQGPASSKDFIREVAKSSSGGSAEDPKSLSIVIEPEIAAGNCIVGLRVLVDRSSTPQSYKIDISMLKRSLDITALSSAPKRYYDLVFSRLESAQLSALRDRIELHCESESAPITALLAIEVYAMPRSAFYQSISVASLCLQHQHWPWPLSSQPESILDFPNETLLASALRLCLNVCHRTGGEGNSMQSILSRVLGVVGKPCFSRLESLFHLLLMEVVPNTDPPQFPEIADCLRICGCAGLRMFLSWRHLHAQISQSQLPFVRAGKQLMQAIDDALAALGKSSAAAFGTFLCKCPGFFQDQIEVATKFIISFENCHLYHFPGLLSSLFEFVCESSLAIAQGHAPEQLRQDLIQCPMRFMATCISCEYGVVREAAQARLMASFASSAQQAKMKSSKHFLESPATTKPTAESVVSLSSENDASASVPEQQPQQQQQVQQQPQSQQHQQQRMTTIFNTAARSVPGTRYRCDLCDTCPIVGPRYHCAHPDCVDFDLCTACFDTGDYVGSTHRASHDVVLMSENPVAQQQLHVSLSGSHPPNANVRLARRRTTQH